MVTVVMVLAAAAVTSLQLMDVTPNLTADGDVDDDEGMGMDICLAGTGL